MRLSIHSKLFLTILLACVILLIGTHAFVQWSFQRGLLDMANAREQERIERISKHLILFYQRDQSWEPIAKSPRLWFSILHAPPEPDFVPPPEPEHFDQPPPWDDERLEEPRQPPPPERRHERQPRHRHPVPLARRLTLISTSGAVIQGRAVLASESRRYPLRLNGEQIGALVLMPGPPLPLDAEIRFRSSQGDRLWIIATAMLLLSAVLAYPLSRRLVKPLRNFQQAARQLSEGDFSTRVPVKGNDELARLGRDINALAAALEQHEQARRRWVADISHELRTPIALLRAELEALQDGIRPLDRACLDTLHADAVRLGRLVDDLYELSTTDMGALGYRMEPTDIGEVLSADVDAFRRQFEEAGVKLEYRDSQDGPTLIHADAQRLSQLFRNLLRNSLQYTDAGGRSSVELDTRTHHVVIDFQDTAPAVPPEALPRLFERLYRVDGSRSRHTGGAGLGLAIAQNVVEAHSGEISAAPAPGGGLWIRIRLPLPD